MDNQVIFYSWQSDDNKTKAFIDKHLKNAIKSLKNNPKLELRPVLDDSTKGKLGAVEIPDTIFKKIDDCDVFVADITFIGECGERRVVNQNVMYELGYAIGKHGDGRVIMLFNSDSGNIKDLPFDISHRRALRFSIDQDKNGESLESVFLNILPAYFENARLIKQLPKDKEFDLDNEEIAILKLYATIENDKRIMILRTLDGYMINIPDIHNDKMLGDVVKNQGEQKFVANLDDLVKKDILKFYLGSNSTSNYELGKSGFDIIEKLKNDENK